LIWTGKNQKPDEHRRKSVRRAMPARIFNLSGLCNWFKSAALRAIKLSPAIFRRVANPVQPFGFPFVQDRLPLSLLAGVCHRLRQRADLFDQLHESQANVFQDIHDDFFAPVGR
jgi:hypothetical protein